MRVCVKDAGPDRVRMLHLDEMRGVTCPSRPVAGEFTENPTLRAVRAIAALTFDTSLQGDRQTRRVPHVRTSVHGLKTTGRSPFNALCHVGRKGRLLRLASWCIEQKLEISCLMSLRHCELEIRQVKKPSGLGEARVGLIGNSKATEEMSSPDRERICDRRPWS